VIHENTRIEVALDRSWPSFVSLVRDLIRARSVSGAEAGAQELVAERLRRAGARVDAFDVDPRELAKLPGWGPTETDYSGRPNVVAVIAGAGRGRSLILNAHIDSVVPGPIELWDRDPWSAAIEGDRIYGRGAWDDKVGVAVIVWLAEALHDAGIQLAGDLIIQSVIDEEISGNGTLACMARGYRADAAVVVDGRGPGTAVTAHCGQLWFRVTAHGRTAAAVESWRGQNAIEMLLAIVAELRQLESVIGRDRTAPFDRVEHPVQLNIGIIQGGATPTTVPALATMDCHLTFPGPLTLDDAKGMVREALARVADRERWTADVATEVEFLSLQVSPFVAPPSEALLAALDRSQREILGVPLERRAIAGFGDLRHFQIGGPTPCCIYGPTAGGGPHAANEWVDLAPVPGAARVLAAFVLDWCGTA
jgi:acetylornithine deacetylase